MKHLSIVGNKRRDPQLVQFKSQRVTYPGILITGYPLYTSADKTAGKLIARVMC